jgi:hypothetical protein
LVGPPLPLLTSQQAAVDVEIADDTVALSVARVTAGRGGPSYTARNVTGDGCALLIARLVAASAAP